MALSERIAVRIAAAQAGLTAEPRPKTSKVHPRLREARLIERDDRKNECRYSYWPPNSIRSCRIGAMTTKHVTAATAMAMVRNSGRASHPGYRKQQRFDGQYAQTTDGGSCRHIDSAVGAEGVAIVHGFPARAAAMPSALRTTDNRRVIGQRSVKPQMTRMRPREV